MVRLWKKFPHDNTLLFTWKLLVLLFFLQYRVQNANTVFMVAIIGHSKKYTFYY